MRLERLLVKTKRTLKHYNISRNPLLRWGSVFISFIGKKGMIIRQFIVNRDFRAITLLKFFKGKEIHQTTPLTFMNRYPEIFSACSDYFKGQEHIKILSFGCSTGEEVLTIREYFPTAQIIGAEINGNSLKKCKELEVDDQIKFIKSTPKNIKKYGPFDAIFCMAVLQRQPHLIASKAITSLKDIYPFEKFEQQIIKFDEILNQNGLAIIHFTQYSLLDTSVARKFQPLGNYCQKNYVSPVFDKNSKIVKNQKSYNTIFIKVK